MNIAFIMYPGACYMGKGDGIKMQAEIWLNELKHKGHNVEKINPWGHYDWKSFDIVHVFGLGTWNYDVVHWGCGLNSNFVFSPIIDTNTPMWKYRIATRIGCSKLRLFSQNYALRQIKNDIKLFFARTEYEANYLKYGYGIDHNKIRIIPLSYRDDHYNPNVPKENFCMFAGTMTQPRKNVPNLVLAAKKYGFRLLLVGNVGNADSETNLRSLINNAKNIEIKGFVSDDELISLYNRAKVFALPSLNEGVGLVALEAAIHGCNIVITKLGGPKEYYDEGAVQLVDPYNIDDIGQAVLQAMNDNKTQPILREQLISKYNVSKCTDLLLQSYQNVLSQK
jgi:glycosyltransferase involved in cell wall biosynthesis